MVNIDSYDEAYMLWNVTHTMHNDRHDSDGHKLQTKHGVGVEVTR